jgi:hypothetical protein
MNLVSCLAFVKTGEDKYAASGRFASNWAQQDGWRGFSIDKIGDWKTEFQSV